MFKNRRIKKGWMKLRVLDYIIETHDTKTFFFVDNQDNNVGFDYFSGQYLTFRFDGLEKRPLVRSYTISSAPSFSNSIAITIKKEEDGIVSNYFCSKIKTGDILKARGPIGRFIYDPRQDKKSLVMFAGGSGITPFMSIIREYKDQLGQQNCPQKLTLIASYKTVQDFIFAKELHALMSHPDITIIVTFTREIKTIEPIFHRERISAKLLKSILKDSYKDHTYMTCGPQELMDTVITHLKEHNVTDKNIKIESFVN